MSLAADFIDLIEELAEPRPDLSFMMPSPQTFATVAGAHSIGNLHDIVLYSSGTNAWATRLFLMFRAMGHDRVQVLNGGWEKWIREGRAVSNEPPRHRPIDFVPHPRAQHFLSKDDVFAVLGDSDACLIHTLPPQIFTGQKLQYARPGHIPGSINVPVAIWWIRLLLRLP